MKKSSFVKINHCGFLLVCFFVLIVFAGFFVVVGGVLVVFNFELFKANLESGRVLLNFHSTPLLGK